MINSHPLYQLSYRGIPDLIIPLSEIVTNWFFSNLTHRRDFGIGITKVGEDNENTLERVEELCLKYRDNKFTCD